MKRKSKGIILAVDDAPESLLVLNETLVAEGYDVRPADSGELALGAVTAQKPELILLDIRMPGMDGLEVCRRLKDRAETRDIPVMFISAVTDVSGRVEGLRLGAVDFVSKPFHREELVARIETHLELSRLRYRLEHLVAERTADLKAANEQLRLELSERVRAEHALRESEERFRSMANNAPVVIWTSAPEATEDNFVRLNFVNSYGLTLVGRTLEELSDRGWTELIHPDDLERVHPDVDPTVGVQREHRSEYRVRRTDGQYRWMLDTATPRYLPDGTFAGHVGIGVDITELKEQQERLIAAQKLESLGVLISGIAHNFNNLMGAIIAEADLALSDLPANAAPRGSVERIGAVATRAAGIVSLLTAYASAGAPTDVMTVNVSDVVREIVELIQASVSKNVVFRVELARKIPPVWADIAQVRQLAMNVLANACEALGSQPGSVCVQTSALHVLGEVANGYPDLSPGDYVHLRVTDSGCGIPAEVMDKIFDPFFTTKFLGRGLGLAVVQGYVRRLGGSIRVQSKPGQGSTFEIFLPSVEKGRFDV